jgi:hypothetical protein
VKPFERAVAPSPPPERGTTVAAPAESERAPAAGPATPESAPAAAPAEPVLAVTPRPTGPAAAAVLAAGIAVLALGGANLIAAAYGTFEEALLVAGRLFLPGGARLATFAGKELVFLVTWFLSWALLHWRLHDRQVSLIAVIGLFLACLGIATLLLWPPVVFALARLLH